MSTSELAALPLNYLDKALNRLRDIGLMPEKPEESPGMSKNISLIDS